MPSVRIFWWSHSEYVSTFRECENLEIRSYGGWFLLYNKRFLTVVYSLRAEAPIHLLISFTLNVSTHGELNALFIRWTTFHLLIECTCELHIEGRNLGHTKQYGWPRLLIMHSDISRGQRPFHRHWIKAHYFWPAHEKWLCRAQIKDLSVIYALGKSGMKKLQVQM